ncbi:MAG: DUF899 family protein [Planctomycetota bacterium]|jgi:predicted dithiol-disulfide oxidoreductase (DUF899 family)
MTAEKSDLDRELEKAATAVREARVRLVDLCRQAGSGPFRDHELTAWDGSKVKLSELFGEQDDLIVIHNMGVRCPYCTLWADGFTGLLPHLSNRAAFVVVSPDPPEVQEAFARGREWGFRMLSAAGTSFTREAGFEGEDGSPWPGFSTFRRTEEGVERVSKGFFGPGDEFCSVWHFLDHLADGPAGWQPRFSY